MRSRALLACQRRELDFSAAAPSGGQTSQRHDPRTVAAMSRERDGLLLMICRIILPEK